MTAYAACFTMGKVEVIAIVLTSILQSKFVGPSAKIMMLFHLERSTKIDCKSNHEKQYWYRTLLIVVMKIPLLMKITQLIYVLVWRLKTSAPRSGRSIDDNLWTDIWSLEVWFDCYNNSATLCPQRPLEYVPGHRIGWYKVINCHNLVTFTSCPGEKCNPLIGWILAKYVHGRRIGWRPSQCQMSVTLNVYYREL